MKLASLFPILLLISATFAQQTKPVDAVRYWDENKRWYNEFTEHWFHFHDISENDVRDSIVFWEKIGRDLEDLAASGGMYGNGGDTHGDYLRWSEASGFIWLNVNKCAGGPMRITRGRVIVSPSIITFVPEAVLGSSAGHGHHGSHPSSRVFVPVRWRNIEYLIAESRIKNFADYAAGLDHSESGIYDGGMEYFVKWGGKEIGNENELPVFPTEYARYIKNPFKAKIVAIGKTFRRSKPAEFDENRKAVDQDYDDLVTQVTVDLGKRSGLTKDVLLRFLIEDDDYSIEGIEIQKVGDSYAVGEYVRDIPKKTCVKTETEDCLPPSNRPLRVGQKLSTTGVW